MWGRSAGRCEYPGCNKPLYEDEPTKIEFNSAYIAHIVAASPGGPRGNSKLSGELKHDINNLMLLCDTHHRLIDNEQVENHTVEILQKYKKNHENRIALVTGIGDKKRSEVILYGAKIGASSSPLRKNLAYQELLNHGYIPASENPYEIGLKNFMSQDDCNDFFNTEMKNLEQHISNFRREKLNSERIAHLSIFAFAPQPLLAYFGALISDITPTEVYQIQRDTHEWHWPSNDNSDPFITREADTVAHEVAIIISISSTINKERVHNLLGENIPIWEISIEKPHPDFLKSKYHLNYFRQSYRKVLNKIRNMDGLPKKIHIFPATPVSIAVEIGRMRNQKADLPLVMYDQNNKKDGFWKVLTIGAE
ncbi:MAG: HNH endonuclease [Salinispira sp.]